MRARRRVPICAPFLRVNGQSARIGTRDLLFWQVNTRSLRAARPLICPFTPKAGANGDPKTRDSLTPFEMTLCKWFEYTEKFKLYHYHRSPNSRVFNSSASSFPPCFRGLVPGSIGVISINQW